MTSYVRTWKHRIDTDGNNRWDLLVNKVAIPGGYVVKIEDGRYDAHYPRAATRTLPSLEEAQRCLELAPPITQGEFPIAKALNNDDTSLISIEEAAAILGMSRYRVNAMVVNGTLIGSRQDGEILVSRKSVEAQISGNKPTGPRGKFADRFVAYSPDENENRYYLVQIDHNDTSAMEKGQRFVSTVKRGEIHGDAELLTYRQAMRFQNQIKRSPDEHLDDHSRKIEQVTWQELKDIACSEKPKEQMTL